MWRQSEPWIAFISLIIQQDAVQAEASSIGKLLKQDASSLRGQHSQDIAIEYNDHVSNLGVVLDDGRALYVRLYRHLESYLDEGLTFCLFKVEYRLAQELHFVFEVVVGVGENLPSHAFV